MLDLSQSPPPKIVIGFPYPGGCCMPFATARSLYRGSLKYDCAILANEGSWDGMNALLANALNLYRQGQATHFAMLHCDIAAEEGWLDVLYDELRRLGADMVSAIVPIKDHRGVTSSGIIDPNDRWHPLKRFTMREVFDLPETFDAADAGYAEEGLLHNDGCMMLDLASPCFQARAGDVIRASFDFPRQIVWNADKGLYEVRCESEDWYFSRILKELGAKTYITRKVQLVHVGTQTFTNAIPWGSYRRGDDDSAGKWREETAAAGA